jgi:hypothetical protein
MAGSQPWEGYDKPGPLSPVRRKVINMLVDMDTIWSEIEFGRYTGCTLPELLFVDPDYFFWVYEQGVFNGMCGTKRLYRRATSIRIPPRYGPDLAVEYIICSGRFEGMQLSPANMALDGGGSTSLLKPVIDMSFPRSLRAFDKGGMKIMIRDLKEIVFGNPSHRMTKQRIVEFFAKDNNFLLPEAT